MESSEKLRDKIQQLRKALAGLGAFLKIESSALANEVMRDMLDNARVQKFEYCIELTWKTGKKYLEVEMKKEVRFPLQVFKEFFLAGLLSQEDYETLVAALEARNKLSHLYSEDFFKSQVSLIPGFAIAMNNFLLRLESQQSQ